MATTALNPDIVLIGAGIMSATLGVLLKQLDPSLTIEIFERLDTVAAESSAAWNNAGTGHSAFCELNYTPEQPDGSIDIHKAIEIASSFEVSKQFWAYLVQQQLIQSPNAFINRIPHMSFVQGEADINFLRKRQQALIRHPLFADMQFSDQPEQLKQWIPLMMQDRDPQEHVAATRMEPGTDVNFGTLTNKLFDYLKTLPGVHLHLEHEVRDLDEDGEGHWYISVKDTAARVRKSLRAKFVFIGAGGGALPLLERTHIPAAKGYGGFPVSGQWLICHNERVIAQHAAKVYGKAGMGAPPMSVPHLDTRMIDGKKALLFGPYAGFSTRFLKHGSLMDLPGSITFGNIRPMLSAGIHNILLTKYLLDQVRQSPEERMETLKEFVPDAVPEDWTLSDAGQRVQVIKKDEHEGGILEFGTEIVHSADGSVAALLGASPGASTSVSIMLDLLQRCFPQQMASASWQEKLQAMIPTYGKKVGDDPVLCAQTRARTSDILALK